MLAELTTTMTLALTTFNFHIIIRFVILLSIALLFKKAIYIAKLGVRTWVCALTGILQKPEEMRCYLFVNFFVITSKF